MNRVKLSKMWNTTCYSSSEGGRGQAGSRVAQAYKSISLWAVSLPRFGHPTAFLAAITDHYSSRTHRIPGSLFRALWPAAVPVPTRSLIPRPHCRIGLCTACLFSDHMFRSIKRPQQSADYLSVCINHLLEYARSCSQTINGYLYLTCYYVTKQL